MNTLELIANRYTTRSYTGEPVDRADLEKIALAGLQAPSSTNQQPWHIVVVTDKDVLAKLDNAALEALNTPEHKNFYESVVKRGGKVFYNAPAIFFVAVRNDNDPKGLKSCARDGGILVENLALAATSLGYGNTICGLAGVPFMTENAEEYRKMLGFPEGYDFCIALLVGKTDTEPTPHEIDKSKLSWV